MKTELGDLGIFGGHPAFDQPLHVGRPNIGNRARLMERLNEMLDRRWLSNNGPFVQEFERAIAAYLGVKHCIAMCNGTVALEITIRALGLRGEVIVPSFTFIATAHALQWQEITPVFCDIDPKTHTLDPEEVGRMVTPRTTGIVGVHVWGTPCNVEALERVAQRHKLALMFDASHAFGNSYRGRMIGNFGRAEVFSFHPTKFFNAFEGGAVVTNDGELAAKIRLMKNFGFAGYDNVIDIGTNGKMSESAAAMGLTNLESVDEFVAANRRNYLTYRRELEGLPGIRLYHHDEQEKHNFHYIVVEIDREVAGISRDQLVEVLHAENILARRYFYPGCHRMAPYRQYFPHAGLLLPETEALTERVMVLPNGTAVSEQDIQGICSVIRLALTHGDELSRRLAERRQGALA